MIILPFLLMAILIAFNFIEGWKDAYLWIEVNKIAPHKYTDKKKMHKALSLSRGIVYLLALIALAYVFDIENAVVLTFGFWLQHFLIHAGTYYYNVNEIIPDSYPYGFFTNETDGDNDSKFDRYFKFQRKFIGRKVLFAIGTLIIISQYYVNIRKSF